MATLGQGRKVLELCENTPTDRMQVVLESGFLSDYLSSGTPEALAKRVKKEKLEAMWLIVERLTDLKDVYVTVTRDMCQDNGPDGKSNTAFQVRCWKGKPDGGAYRGHVDSGSSRGILLFEAWLNKPLEECSCCWPEQLAAIGISTAFRSSDERKKQTILNRDGSQYDLISFGE
jgi:hypothetical protein